MTIGMNFKLVDNWLEVIKYAYSFLFSILSAVMAGSATMLQFYQQGSPEFALVTKVLTTASALFAGLSAFARVWQQKNVSAVEKLKD